MKLDGEAIRSTGTSAADSARLVGIISKITRVWKAADVGTDIENPLTDKDLETLQRLSDKYGMRVDVFRHPHQVINGLHELEDDFCQVPPEDVVHKFIEKAPDFSEMVADAPKDCWQIVSIYLPTGDPDTEEGRIKNLRRQWALELLEALVTRVRENRRVLRGA